MIKKTLSLAVISVCLILFGANVSVPGQDKVSQKLADEQAKERDIRRLLISMDSGKIGAQIMDQMFSTIRRSMRQQVPQEIWDDLIAEFKIEFSPEKLVELNLPIYAKHYTHDEIKQLIAFYESPLGKKMTSVTPLIVKEGYDVGVAHGRQVLQKIYQKLERKGYKPPVS